MRGRGLTADEECADDDAARECGEHR
jgi:hypothetical protein